MVRTSLLFSATWLMALLLFSSTGYSLDIRAQALLKNTVVLMIDGKQRMLKVGKRSPEGVLLLSANAKMAVIEVDGQQRQLTLSNQISSRYNPVKKVSVSIPRNRNNQYISNASINGRRVQVLVDTGANVVALSSRDAITLGIDYTQGRPSKVVTAGGVRQAYSVVLNSVTMGSIEVNRVRASVVEGDYPEMVLLGMSYLQHVDMHEQGSQLILQARY